jgi:hypothetical protein
MGAPTARNVRVSLVANRLKFFRAETGLPSPPIQRPFFLEAAILSRIRSPVTSRSNRAKDRSTLRVSRAIEVVLGDRDEGDAAGIEELDDLGEIRERAREAVDLVLSHPHHEAGRLSDEVIE